MGGEKFFLDAADRQNFAAQCDFARHCYVVTGAFAGQSRNHRGCQCDARARTVFRNRAFGNVDVQIFFVKILLVNAEFFGACADAGQCGIRRFLHYFAEFAG